MKVEQRPPVARSDFPRGPVHIDVAEIEIDTSEVIALRKVLEKCSLNPLVLSKAFMPMVYKRNYIQRGDAFNIEGNEISFDCMTELVFADRDDLSAWMASLGVDEIARDEKNFVDRAYVVDERTTAG